MLQDISPAALQAQLLLEVSFFFSCIWVRVRVGVHFLLSVPRGQCFICIFIGISK